MSTITVDPTLIETLADLLDRTGLSEIELAEGDARVRVVRQLAPVTVAPAAAPAPVEAPEPAERPLQGAVLSPMVGTVYLAPEPGAQPFVTVGGRVEEGQTLMIIEAMKVMNPIRAPRSGTVSRILVENAGPVEYGEPLLVLV
ncbi:MAG: acetyl-CoA carboxylase biotin carboxyl carrier protein [Pseudomonadota bacterium]